MGLIRHLAALCVAALFVVQSGASIAQTNGLRLLFPSSGSGVGAGQTSARPAIPASGAALYYDQSLGKLLYGLGTHWYDMTGAQVADYVPPGALRSIATARTGLPTWSRAQSNTSNNYNSVYQSMSFIANEDITGNLIIKVGNFTASGAPLPSSFCGESAVTDRYSIWDGTTNYPISFPGNVRNITLQPCATATSLPVSGLNLRKGARAMLVYGMTYATAPSVFPAMPVPALTNGEENNWGNNLDIAGMVDTYSLRYTRPVGTWAIRPPIAIMATPNGQKATLAIDGDSIGSEGVDIAANDNPTYGVLELGARLAGVSAINLGASSLSLAQEMANSTALNQKISVAQAAGVKYWISNLCTNDLAAGQSPSQIYANQNTLKGQLDAVGIKLLLTTCTPKTNYTSQVTAYNALVRNNNGVGYGYYDLNAIMRGADEGTWRSDLRQAASVAVATGGTGFIVNQEIVLTNGIIRKVSQIDNGNSGGPGAITGLQSPSGYNDGSFLTDPTGPVGLMETLQLSNGLNTQSGYGIAAGTGATLTVTGQAAGAGSQDGTHPRHFLHDFGSRDFASKLPALAP